MSKRVRILTALALLLLVALAAIVIAIHRADLPSVLASRLSAETGREVSIGALTLRPGLRPGLRLKEVVVGEAAEPSRLQHARIGQLDLVLALSRLLWGEVKLSEVEIGDAVVEVGSSAAAASAETAATPRPEEGWSVVVKRVRVHNTTLTLRREGAAEPTTAHIEAASVHARHKKRLFEAQLAGTIEGVGFDLSGNYDTRPRPGGVAQAAAVGIEGQIAGANVSGKGTLEDADGKRALELRVEAEAPSLHALSRAAGRELPKLAPVRASGRLTARAGTLGVSDLDVAVGNRKQAWFELTGHARDVVSRLDFSLQSEFGFDDVRVLGPLVGNPPDIGRVVGRASIENAAGSTRLHHFTLQGGRKGVFEIDARGSFEHVEAVEGLAAQLDVEARDLAVIGELVKRALPPIGPVSFSGEVRGQAGKVEADGVRARLHRTHFRGAFSGDFGPNKRPRFSARVDVPELYLQDIGVEPEPLAEPAAPIDAPARENEPLFSATPIDFGALANLDGSLLVRAEQLLGVEGALAHGVQLDARLEQGRLLAHHVALDYEGGEVDARLDLDIGAAPPTLALEARATGMQLGQLLDQIDEHKAWSGTLGAKLDLRTEGDSLHALASGLDGRAALSCGEGTIDPAYAGLLTRDLFHAVRSVLTKPAKSERLNCLIADFEFKSGVGTARSLVLDAQELMIVGEGDVDLGGEEVRLRLVPRPRKASPLSTAVTVRLAGPLAAPHIKIEKGSLVTSTTEAVFKNVAAWSGASTLWRGITRKRSRPPCEALLEAAQQGK